MAKLPISYIFRLPQLLLSIICQLVCFPGLGRPSVLVCTTLLDTLVAMFISGVLIYPITSQSQFIPLGALQYFPRSLSLGNGQLERRPLSIHPLAAGTIFICA